MVFRRISTMKVIMLILHKNTEIIKALKLLHVYDHILRQYQEGNSNQYFLKASNGKLVGAGHQLPTVSRHFDDMIQSMSLFQKACA